MQRKFVTNLALLLGLNLLIKTFWVLGIDRAVQNAVGTEQYGFYYAIFNFSFLLNILLDLGITNFNNKNIAQNNHLLSKHFSSIVILRLFLAGVFTVITLIGGWLIGYTADMMKMLAAVVFNQILISFIMYLRSNLAGLHQFKTDSVISVLDRFIMSVICAVLLVKYNEPGSFQLKWFVYAQTFAYILTAAITFLIVLKKAKVRRFQWRWPFFLMILKKSYPYAVLVLLMTFYNRIDGVMLERLLPFRIGANEAGIYASAYRLLDAANMIAFLFAGLLLPIFALMIKLKQDVQEMVSLSFSLLVIPAMIVSCCCAFYSFEWMDLLYHGEHIEESATVFRILMCCFVPISATYIYGTLLTANGSLRQLNIMASSGMVLNVVLNLFLIPRYQATGAAISSITTQLFTCLAQVIMVTKIFRFRAHIERGLKLSVFLILCVLINLGLRNAGVSWMAGFSLSATGCFLLAFSLGLIRPKSIYRIIRYDEQ
ncbi:MAG: oligosaccharide flippase family protein [Bacteroidota bacterium]